jgi:D-alanine-D-alanine ligase
VREALRCSGVDARIFSIFDGIEHIGRSSENVIFPIAERYPPGRGSDRFGLRRELEARQIPFVGSGYAATRLAADKARAKQVLAAAGLTTPKGICLEDRGLAARALKEFLDETGCPAVVKPVGGPGGSYGVRYVERPSDLEHIVRDWSNRRQQSILIEEYVEGDELTVWVTGTATIRCRKVIEIAKGRQPIFDRSLKYRGNRGAGESQGEVTGASNRGDARRAAVEAHRAVGAYSYSRVDLVVRDGVPIVLEVNTRPNLIVRSGLAIASRDRYPSFLLRFVDDAVERSIHDSDL